MGGGRRDCISMVRQLRIAAVRCSVVFFPQFLPFNSFVTAARLWALFPHSFPALPVSARPLCRTWQALSQSSQLCFSWLSHGCSPPRVFIFPLSSPPSLLLPCRKVGVYIVTHGYICMYICRGAHVCLYEI